ncbi:MAG: AlpA family phage regulatory protein [Hyphomicrobium sp.]
MPTIFNSRRLNVPKTATALPQPPLPPTPTLAAAGPPQPPRKPKRLLGLREVTQKVSLARATIYRLIKKGRLTGQKLFPDAVMITERRIGWRDDEIDDWIMNRPRAHIDAILNEPDSEAGDR